MKQQCNAHIQYIYHQVVSVKEFVSVTQVVAVKEVLEVKEVLIFDFAPHLLKETLGMNTRDTYS